MSEMSGEADIQAEHVIANIGDGSGWSPPGSADLHRGRSFRKPTTTASRPPGGANRHL